MPSKIKSGAEVVKGGVLTTLVSAQGKDFSGQDFGGQILEGGNFFESIFNGCSFSGIQASQSVFQHTEFTETQFERCTFQDSSFDHSDFVMATLRDCRFIRCSFQNAEWRDTDFLGVSFEQCIFRNTTTSLTLFVDCSFDNASAANFVGTSKRYTVFSRTTFCLPKNQLQFLRTAFGITGPLAISVQDSEDVLLRLSTEYYKGSLSSELLYRLMSSALKEIGQTLENPQILKMRYLCAVCRSLIAEDFLSVFAIQFLQDAISRQVYRFPDERQVLEIINLTLGLRIAVRERSATINKEAADIAGVFASSVGIRMEFERTYDKEAIGIYLNQLALFCNLPRSQIQIKSFKSGSTLVDILINTGTQVADLFRFVRSSLSLATVAISQAGKLKKEYNRLAKGKNNGIRKSVSRRSPRVKATNTTLVRQQISEELIGVKSEATKSIEVLVDTANDRVLVLDGRVQVTISLR